MTSSLPVVNPAALEQIIFIVRGQKVILGGDLAKLYGVTTKALNQAVRRNAKRFPIDFCFKLSKDELKNLQRLRSQTVTLKRGEHPKYLPFAFTEQGVAMLSSVLNSERAIRVNIEIMRAFVRLRQLLASNTELAQKLAVLEKKYNKQFKVVFQAIRQLMDETRPAAAAGREIGFHTIKQRAPKSRAIRKLVS